MFIVNTVICYTYNILLQIYIYIYIMYIYAHQAFLIQEFKAEELGYKNENSIVRCKECTFIFALMKWFVFVHYTVIFFF